MGKAPNLNGVEGNKVWGIYKNGQEKHPQLPAAVRREARDPCSL